MGETPLGSSAWEGGLLDRSESGFLNLDRKHQSCWIGFPLSRQNRKSQGPARTPEVFRVLSQATLSALLIASRLSWIQVHRMPTMVLENRTEYRPEYLMFNHSLVNFPLGKPSQYFGKKKASDIKLPPAGGPAICGGPSATPASLPPLSSPHPSRTVA